MKIEMTQCDVSGEIGGAEHEIVLDGVSYEFDCTDAIWERLKGGLKDVTENPAVRVSGRKQNRGLAGLTKAERAGLKLWCQHVGIDYPVNGRVKDTTIQQWRDEGSPMAAGTESAA